MAGWISSKLKVAETLLQQIDQQAAESLRKNERSGTIPSFEDADRKGIATAEGVVGVPLKLQLKKKPSRSAASRRSFSDERDGRRQGSSQIEQTRIFDSTAAVADGDWTELLGANPSPSGAVSASAAKIKSVEKRGAAEKLKSVKRTNDARISGSGEEIGHDVDKDDGASSIVVERAVKSKREVRGDDSGGIDKLERGNLASGGVGSSGWSTSTMESSAPRGSSVGVSESSGGSGSETDSGSSTDSEKERERMEERRKRRERINAEKVAEAIKEREDVVAKLEGEKQSLEKILEERRKQQAHEASELQTTMMETMEAVDLEKQRHNSTRMEALARVAALESINAELARSLATTQWTLEVEANRVEEVCQQIDFKKLVQEELRSKLSKFHQSAPSLNKLTSEGAEYEEGMLQVEYSFVCDKIKSLKEKAKKIEENIELTRKEIMEPTEVEIELKGRLEQLTDRLIQKQSQVESLSSEKAMLLFRIETILKFLDDIGMSSQLNNLNLDSIAETTAGPSVKINIEGETWAPLHPSLKTRFHKIRSAKRHLGSFIRQLDFIFSAGALFLRKNPIAKFWSLVYIVCLHFWVIYVLMSHSSSSSGLSSSAALSLENINKTTNL